METPDYFARVPYALYDARRQNVITSLQFNIMTILHRWANWHTGVVRTCSAERLQQAMGDLEKPPSERTIQRHMQGLHEADGSFLTIARVQRSLMPSILTTTCLSLTGTLKWR